jgi:Flp pilus assembly protein TadB
MDSSAVLGLGALLLLLLLGAGFAWYTMVLPGRKSAMSSLRAQSLDETGRAGRPGQGRVEPTQEVLQELKQNSRKKQKKSEVVELEDKFFQAGMFSADERRIFFMWRTFTPIALAPIAGIIGASNSAMWGIVAAILGAALGVRIPYMMLDRKIAARQEDILFYLPLVIEQIVIGVSSSLDVGPCVQRVVSMADERDSHNCVTELLRITQHYISSGVSFQEALVDIGRRSGHTELKHTFVSLAQVASHGGEVTRQLQELADAVSNQREAKIETKIKKLELAATVPVAVVFCGFLIIIVSGFGIQIKQNLK